MSCSPSQSRSQNGKSSLVVGPALTSQPASTRPDGCVLRKPGRCRTYIYDRLIAQFGTLFVQNHQMILDASSTNDSNLREAFCLALSHAAEAPDTRAGHIVPPNSE